MLSQLLGSHRLVTLDIGSHSIKALEAQDRGDTVEITALGTAATPPGALDNGIIIDHTGVTEAVRQLLASLGIGPGPAATAVTDPSLVATRIQMPRSLQRNLHRTIRFEARKHVPFDVDESLIECQVLDPGESGEQMTVLLVAVRRPVVQSRVAVMEATGLDPVYVDIEQFASLRALVYASRDPRVFRETLALIRIGHTFTEMAMVRNGAFVFPRIVPIAGGHMDRAISASLSVDMEEARRIKEQRAVAVRRDQLSSLPEDRRPISQVVAPALEEITRDIQRSFIFLATQLQLDPSRTPVHRAFLSGGVANMENIAAYLSGQLNVPVEVINVFNETNVTVPGYDANTLTALAPSVSALVGLALRDVVVSGRYRFSGVPERDVVGVAAA
jgi:type IV pilus assembly protein PilM